jgi:hypothetical protein
MLNISMRFFEFTTAPTQEKARLNALKQQKDRAATALKTERERQKKQKATTALQQANQTLAKLT